MTKKPSHTIITDHKASICTECREGIYQTINIHDDVNSIVSCTTCNHSKLRWSERKS